MSLLEGILLLVDVLKQVNKILELHSISIRVRIEIEWSSKISFSKGPITDHYRNLVKLASNSFLNKSMTDHNRNFVQLSRNSILNFSSKIQSPISPSDSIHIEYCNIHLNSTWFLFEFQLRFYLNYLYFYYIYIWFFKIWCAVILLH